MEREAIVTIERMASGGLGLARIDGRVVFLPGVLPGEEVVVEVLETKSDYGRARPLEVIKPHPQRCRPVCSLFPVCGGCQLMHMDYSLQPELKTEAALERLLDDRTPECRIVPSPLPLGYRDRVRLQAAMVDGRLKTGFFTGRSNKLIPVETCPQLSPKINAFLPVLDQWADEMTRLDPRPTGFEILAGPFSEGMIVVPDLPRKPSSALMEMTQKREATVCFSVKGKLLPRKKGPKEGLPWLERPDTGLKLLAFPGVFTQVNTSVNSLLVEAVLSAGDAVSPKSILDLYAGFGNFSLPLASRGPYVTAVEDNPAAVEAGKLNAEMNGLKNVAFLRAKAEKGVAEAADRGRRFDLVILDPPRTGAKGLGPSIARLGPKRILYVSCHPASLIRDLAEFRSFGYRLTELTAFDMFPQTAHIEVLAVLDQ